MKKRTSLLIGLLMVTVSCQPAPLPTMSVSATETPVAHMATAAPPAATVSLPAPTLGPQIAALLTATAPKQPAGAHRVLQQGSLHVGDLDRSYSYYAPAGLPPGAPLLLVFHTLSAVPPGEKLRRLIGYALEDLADQHGFLLAYPEGYQVGWNGCVMADSILAKTANVDDLGFVRALIARFHADYGTDTSQVFGFGAGLVGGSMVYRLALELPGEVAAITVAVGNLPTAESMDCQASGKPIPVLLFFATADSTSPYDGGHLASPGVTVRSAVETAEYFAMRNGQNGPPRITRLPHRAATDPTSVDRTAWNEEGKPEVVLITVNGGGHVLPLASGFPEGLSGISGPMTGDIDLPSEMWDFFSRQRPRK